MERFNNLLQRAEGETEEEARQRALEAWGRFIGFQTWFQIPNTLECDRTFARGPTDAYYLEAMIPFIANARNNEWNVPVNIHTIPLATIRDELLARWWARFRHLNQFYDERGNAEHYRLLIPGDAFDTPVTGTTIEQLREIYPRAPDWFTTHRFPAALACPLPFVVFYFHNQIRQAATPAERRFWDLLLQLEYALLYATAWFNEAINGHRGFVLTRSTIDWLRERLGDRPIAARVGPQGGDVRFPAVALLMEGILNTPNVQQNRIALGARDLPDSWFIWTQLFTGFPDSDTPGGQLLRPAKNGRSTLRDENRNQVKVNFNSSRTPRNFHRLGVRPQRDEDYYGNDEPPRQRRRIADDGQDDRPVRYPSGCDLKAAEQEFRAQRQVYEYPPQRDHGWAPPPQRQQQWAPPTPPRNAPQRQQQWASPTPPRNEENGARDTRGPHTYNHPRTENLPPPILRDSNYNYGPPPPIRETEVEYLRRRRAYDYHNDQVEEWVDDRREGESRRDAAMRRTRDLDEANNKMRQTYVFPAPAPPPAPPRTEAEKRYENPQPTEPVRQPTQPARQPQQRQPKKRVDLSQVKCPQFGYLFSKGKGKKTPTAAQTAAAERARLAELDDSFRQVNERREQRQSDIDYNRRLSNYHRYGAGNSQYDQYYQDQRQRHNPHRDRNEDDDDNYVPLDANCGTAHRQFQPWNRRDGDGGDDMPPPMY